MAVIQSAFMSGIMAGVVLSFGMTLTNTVTSLFSRDGVGIIDKALAATGASTAGE